MTVESIETRIDEAIKEAMRAGEKHKVLTLRGVKAALHNAKIEKRVEALEDGDAIAVLAKQVKQRQEAITEFKKGNRPDLVAKEEQEVVILGQFLPQQLSPAELRQIVDRAIQESGAASRKDMGKVMKLVMPHAQGRTDGKIVSDLVSQLLAQKEGTL